MSKGGLGSAGSGFKNFLGGLALGKPRWLLTSRGVLADASVQAVRLGQDQCSCGYRQEVELHQWEWQWKVSR